MAVRSRAGWEHRDWLTFAVTDVSQGKAVGHVGLWNRDGGQVGSGEQGEIGYWTAADSRGRGIAPTAVRAVTGWAFDHFGADRLPRIMLVHDLDNAASCRVAAKSGYPFDRLSPANPPLWFTDGHVHVAEAPARGERADGRGGARSRSPFAGWRGEGRSPGLLRHVRAEAGNAGP